MRYQNPVLPGFHPDPSICRVGDDYYLTVSSFEYFPGLPIYHSRDLVNWKQIGNALQRGEEFPLLTVGDSGGMWAPTIRWHEGVFYVTATLEKYGNFIVSAVDPAGTWSAPVWLPQINGIDPSLYFEDGRAYYCTNGKLDESDPTEMITLCEVDVQTGRTIGERRPIWGGTEARFLEAPHIYRIGEWYYLLVAQGGTFFTHMANIARSRSLFGPYEGCPDNPILTNMCDPTWQVQCSGHADLVEDGQGNWWAVHLGTRLARRTMTHLGRETFLTPVTWVDGWPRCGKAVLNPDGPLRANQMPQAPFTADLSREDWEPEWIFLRRPDMARHAREKGAMLLRPSVQTLRDKTPTFASLRPHGFDNVTEVHFDFDPQPGDEAGLAVRLDCNFHITCTVGRDAACGERVLTLTLAAEDITHVVARCAVPEGEVRLRMTADKEKYVFEYEAAGEWKRVGQVSTRFVATEFQGRCFTGTVIGLYTASAMDLGTPMLVRSFRHERKESIC